MSDMAIYTEGLSKRYKLGAARARHNTFRDLLHGNLQSLFRRYRRPHHSSNAPLWALKDVSLEVKHGEVLGIIGRNGAGKSTLLKILTRITEPTSGRAELYGRVGSLLEVGTGFHNELTGRENIYLSGAILGMKKAEIARKFDEILAFAEVERFIDTPVKHYSSGMYLRLAFAVAAHLEPDILLVDEVLAVGDASFQRKCLGKMEGVAKEGRTVLFISHTMPAVTNLCHRAILLDEGKVALDGPAPQVVGAYLNAGCGTTAAREWHDRAKAPGGDIVRLYAVRVKTCDNQIADNVDIRQPVGIEMEYDVLKAGYVLLPNIGFYNQEGILAFVAQDLDPEWRRRRRPTGRYVSTVSIPGNYLSDGLMYVDVALNTMDPYIQQFHEHHVIAFQVIDSFAGDSARGDWTGPMRGVVRPLLKWTTRFERQ
jgi:lipopolysaccharide transport system ATP-binding protein